MASPRAAFCALLGVSAAFLGCTATLDFDALSAGDARADAGRPLADASVVTGLRDASAPRGSGSIITGGPIRTEVDADVGRDSGPGATEAGTQATDAASEADAGAPTDGVADAGALDPTTFACAKVAPPATFCDDFELPTPIEDRWVRVIAPPTPPGGTVAVDGRAPRAGAGSLLTTLSAGIVPVGDEYYGACVSKAFSKFEGMPARYQIEFDVRVEQVATQPGQQVKIVQLLFGAESEGFTQLALQLQSDGANASARFFEDEYEPVGSAVGPTMPARTLELRPVPNINEWAHVTFVLDATEPGGFNNQVSLSVDDVSLYSGPLHFALHLANPLLDLGFPSVDGSFTQDDPSHAWRARYDNVLVRVEPR